MPPRYLKTPLQAPEYSHLIEGSRPINYWAVLKATTQRLEVPKAASLASAAALSVSRLSMRCCMTPHGSDIGPEAGANGGGLIRPHLPGPGYPCVAPAFDSLHHTEACSTGQPTLIRPAVTFTLLRPTVPRPVPMAERGLLCR
jgi:hypothetical protein